MGRILHSDKCRWWDDEEFCDCGAVEIARLESALAASEKAREEEGRRYARAYNEACDDLRGEFDLKETEYKFRVAQLEEALQWLVDLKRIKSLNGKTPGYLSQQPQAWEKASKALNSSPSGISEVLRAARLARCYHDTECDCTLCHTVRKLDGKQPWNEKNTP